MITVKHSDSLRISSQVLRYLVADNKKSIEWRSLMIFPLVADNILKHCLVYTSTTDIDCNVFIMMLSLHEFSNGVNRVPV